MAIKVLPFAAFAEFMGTRELSVEYRPGLKCSDLWRELKAKYPKIAPVPPLFAVADEYVPVDSELKDGDIVMLFPPVSGGEPAHLYNSPLSVPRALEGILDEDGGGEAIFIGRVRRHNEGKVVKHLFYECRESMAEKEIETIIGEMKSRWPLRKVHMEHRVGKLEVGEIAVIVAVSADHRKEAIDACRYGIDELKKRVPIWKKEVTKTGEVWIGACDHEELS